MEVGFLGHTRRGEGGSRIREGIGDVQRTGLGEMCGFPGLTSYAGWARLQVGRCGP